MMASPIYNWTGFYIGGHIGGAFNDNNNNFGPGVTGGNGNDARFLGGLQVGADYQFASSWVIGAEAQYSWLDRSNNGLVFPTGLTFLNSQRALDRSRAALVTPGVRLYSMLRAATPIPITARI
jgi:outer membrane immunogenic protein